ncbi:MAG: hypothetical protein ACLQDV_13800 [Candidatus Binataceae bacterium]
MKSAVYAGIIAAALSISGFGCMAHESRQAAAEWIGKDRRTLVSQMGKPSYAVPTDETGGEELFYSYQGHHYIFETDAHGLIATAVRTD